MPLQKLIYPLNVPADCDHFTDLTDEQIEKYRAAQDELSIIITYSGKSSLALAQVVSILSKSRSPLLLITSMHNKAYDLNDFDSVLYIPSKQKGPIHFSSISVKMSIFTILYMLYACQFEKDYSFNMEYIQSILKRNNIQE